MRATAAPGAAAAFAWPMARVLSFALTAAMSEAAMVVLLLSWISFPMLQMMMLGWLRSRATMSPMSIVDH